MKKLNSLNNLRIREIHVACFTNSIRETTTLMLRKTGILDMFELVITNQDVENPKPNPEGYLKTD